MAPYDGAATSSFDEMTPVQAVFVLFFLGLSSQVLAQGTPAPFGPNESQHGFSQFETLPPNPEEAVPEPLDYYTTPNAESAVSPDAPPGGLFFDITLAEDFEEALHFRRGNLYRPIHPTDEFSPDTLAVHVVFRVFKHYSSYHVIGRLFPEHVPGLSRDGFFDEDTASLAPEDESGYLKFFAPSEDGWIPGRYRIDIFVGFEANDVTRMGTLHFTVTPNA